jgi:serine O-acetyltransferase
MHMEFFQQDVRRWISLHHQYDPEQISWRMILSMMDKHPGLKAIFWFRLGSWLRERGFRLTWTIQKHIFFKYGLEIAVGSDIQGGLYIPHPSGSQIFPRRIGTNCSIIANVTIGMRNENQFPAIGDNVFIGAGARVLGGITIGENAKIGANAVVISDIPPHTSVGGVPAKVIRTFSQ